MSRPDLLPADVAGFESLSAERARILAVLAPPPRRETDDERTERLMAHLKTTERRLPFERLLAVASYVATPLIPIGLAAAFFFTRS